MRATTVCPYPCYSIFPSLSLHRGNDPTPVDQVIELPDGHAAELGLQVGDLVPLSTLAGQEWAAFRRWR